MMDDEAGDGDDDLWGWKLITMMNDIDDLWLMI